MKDCKTTVVTNSALAQKIYRIVLHVPYMAQQARPGQFVTIKIEDGAHILRRPISICDVDEAAGTITLVYEVRGAGTAWIAGLAAGQSLQVLGPLGNGFSQADCDQLVVVGGGIGIFPLLYALKTHPAKEKTAILGFRAKDAMLLTEEFSAHANEILLCTDDGSFGIHGTVCSPLDALLKENKQGLSLYACGPSGMLKAVNALCAGQGIDPELSMEQRMACGFGACLVCVCLVKAEQEKTEYKQCCTDGPVFLGSQLVL